MSFMRNFAAVSTDDDDYDDERDSKQTINA